MHLHTHKYVILIPFPRQLCFRESACTSMLYEYRVSYLIMLSVIEILSAYFWKVACATNVFSFATFLIADLESSAIIKCNL